MWAAAAMPPSDSLTTGLRRRAASRDAFSRPSLMIPLSPNSSNHPSPVSSHYPQTSDLDSLLEPAIEGPPSPERLRQLSKQMKRASYLNRPRGHRSGSSVSPRSIKDGRPQWEQALDDLPLSRRYSNRSSKSSTPSRYQNDRDSVAALGRIFHRNANMNSGKTKRASSQYSSSSSSMYSSDAPSESKDSILPNLFSRRKPSRDDVLAQKKLQISGPFNFQHVAHTEKNNLPTDLESATEFELDYAVRSTGAVASPGTLNGIQAQDLYFSNISSESIGAEESFTVSPTRPPLVSRTTTPLTPPISLRRMVRPARSTEQLRMSPTKPSRLTPQRSRCPTILGFTDASGPVPPPRVSSRSPSTMPFDGFAALTSKSLDRPRTATGFRRPEPFSPDATFEELPPPPATSHGFVPPADYEDFGIEDCQASHALTTPDDLAWPLTSPVISISPGFETPLADVPEEEEHQATTTTTTVTQPKARTSVSSYQSLRGNLSVPVMRSAVTGRSLSGASETLGLFSSQRPIGDHDNDADNEEAIDDVQENWEDCIDYCYEHEADANFNYQWECPSMDRACGGVPSPALTCTMEDELVEGFTGIALPDLSPASENLSTPYTEIPTPSSPPPVTNNFSLPRDIQSSRISQLKSSRPLSYASSFKESQGFSLSPSLLVPGDYHQQMLEAERYDYSSNADAFIESYQSPFHDDMLPRMHKKSPLSYEHRSSTSTTGSFSASDITNGDRHASTNSSFTTLTRLTMSSSGTSLNKIVEAFESGSGSPVDDFADEDYNDQENSAPTNLDMSDLTPFPPVAPFARKPQHKSHASESFVRGEFAPLKSPDPKFRRPRARTSSLSTQVAPPVGQYALFPRTYKVTGDRI